MITRSDDALRAQARRIVADFGFDAAMLTGAIAAALQSVRDEAQREAAACEARLVEVALQRDKWLGLFNQSEQFQDGPTKRAEAAEAKLVECERQRQAADLACINWHARVTALENAVRAWKDKKPKHSGEASLLQTIALRIALETDQSYVFWKGTLEALAGEDPTCL